MKLFSSWFSLSWILVVGLLVVLMSSTYLYWISLAKPVPDSGPTPTPSALPSSPSESPKQYSLFLTEVEGSEQVFYQVAKSGAKTKLASAPFNPASPELLPSASITPNGKAIVYTQEPEGSLMRLDLATGYIYTLLQGKSYSSASNNYALSASFRQPVISPDGLRVAFTHVGYEWSYVEMVNLDGTGYTENTLLSGNTTQFAWAPDSNSFVHAVLRNDFSGDQAALYVGKFSDPRTARNIHPVDGAANSINYMKDMYTPAWSPDGSKIALGYHYLDIKEDRSNEESAAQYRGIYTIKPDGTNFKQVSNNQSFSSNPHWLDNETLVYALSDQYVGSSHGLYTIKADGNLNTLIYLSTAQAYAIQSVSPDSQRIAFLAGSRNASDGFISSNLYIFEDTQATKLDSCLPLAERSGAISWL